MLARTAENMYWMGRYLERMEGTARLINATTHMLIDSHQDARISWPVLIDVLGEDPQGFIQEGSSSELGVMHYLIEAEDSPASIRNSCNQLRTNARCVREVIPRDFWEEINSLNLFMQTECTLASSRVRRYSLMVEVVRRCQMVVGVMDGTMLRDDAFCVFNIGRHLERADMTTRIMDTLILQQLTPTDGHTSRRQFQWTSLLNALGGTEPYRRYFAQEEGETDVIDFLMSYPEFPRSVFFCLQKIENAVKRLPRSTGASEAIERLRKDVDSEPLTALSTEQLHLLIDQIQARFNDLHTALTEESFKAPGT